MTCSGCGSESGGNLCPMCEATRAVEPAPEVLAPADPGVTWTATVQVLQRQAAATTQVRSRPAAAERLPSLWSERSAIERVVGAAAVLLVIVGLALMVARLGGDSPAQSTVAPKPAVATPHETCVRQLMAMGANMYLNSHFDHEVAVNGPKDPFLPYARKVGEVFTGVQGSDGQDTGASRARGVAEGYCTGALHDAVRANYPTDGSYPA